MAVNPELLAYQNNFPKYASDLLQIRDRSAQVTTLKLNQVQRAVHDVIKSVSAKHRIALFVLKARQTGICLDPDTLVLTADLRWIKLDDVHVGQELMAFDENTVKRPDRKALTRRFQKAIVEEKRELRSPVRRIVFEGGELIATPEHRLLGRRHKSDIQWFKAKDLKVGDTLRHLVSPWDAPTLDDAWMGGIIDGEGHLRKCALGITQAEGLIQDEIIKYLEKNGYTYHHRDDKPHGYGHKQVHQVTINRITEILKMVGQCQPRRFKDKTWWDKIALPGKRIGLDKGKILSIEDLPVRRVIDLQTSCKTFIANGVGSHNSTLTEGMLFHRAHTTPNTRCAVFAHDFSTSENVYSMSRMFYDNLPDEWRPMARYCADTETECLSRAGWCKHSELQVGDEIYSLDPMTGFGKWVPVRVIHQSHYNGPMHLWEASDFNSCTTPDHKWLITTLTRRDRPFGFDPHGKRGGGGRYGSGPHLKRWSITTSEKLNRLNIIPTGAPCSCVEATISDDMLRLYGWVVSEGTYYRQREVRISQSQSANPHKVTKIDKLLQRLNIPFRRFVDKDGTMITWSFNHEFGEYIRTNLPDKRFDEQFITLLSARQASILLETLIDGDGTRKGRTEMYYSADALLIRQIEILAVLSGRSVKTVTCYEHAPDRKRVRDNPRYGNMMSVTLHANPVTWGNVIKKHETIIDYSGTIWCPETETGTWLARRKGTVYFTHNSSKKQIIFENPSKELRAMNPGLRSRIDVFTAGKTTAGRSFNFNCVHLSEFSFYPDGLKLLGALEAAIPDVPGNWMIIETTANGMDNFAYDEWLRYKEHFAKYGENSALRPLFIAWYDLPDYTKAFPTVEMRKQFEDELSAEDADYMTHYQLSWEQMWWRQSRIDALGGDLELFQQEFPANDMEAFMTSGRPIFSMKTINSAVPQLRTLTIREAEIDASGRLYDQAGGQLQVFHPPKPGRSYTIGVDPVVADQVLAPKLDDKADRAVICVIDDETLVQCAEWAGRMDPISLAPIVREIARYFNEGLVIPERNNSGGALIYELQKTYYNIYRAETFNQFGVKITEKLGFQTDLHTKKRLIDFATFVFHQGYCTVNSQALLEEMRTFVDKSGKAEADKRSHHDDRVMAWMLALFGAGKDKTTFHPAGRTPTVESKVRSTEQILSQFVSLAEIDVDGWEKIAGRKLYTRGQKMTAGSNAYLAY